MIQEMVDPAVGSQNSWLTVNICSEGITTTLPPCKPVGSVVLISGSSDDVRIVACGHNGRRANQDCTPIDIRSDGVTLCKVKEPE
jgi:hypothetical protein